MITHARTAMVTVASISLAIAIGGCASARLETEWKSPGFPGRSLKGSTVLAACVTGDEALRRICEDEWATQLQAQGLKLLRAYDIVGLAVGDTISDEMRATAKKVGAATIASTRIASDTRVHGPAGTQVGVGVGGAGGSGGGVTFGGVGISIPIGGGTTTTTVLTASTSLVDVASGAVTWSGTASAPGNEDLRAKVTGVTKVVVDALKGAGAF